MKIKRIGIIMLCVCLTIIIAFGGKGVAYASSRIDIELRGEGVIEVAADVAEVGGCIRCIGYNKDETIVNVKQKYVAISDNLETYNIEISINYCDSYAVDQYRCDGIFVARLEYIVKNISISDIKLVTSLLNTDDCNIDYVRLGNKDTANIYSAAIADAVDNACAKMSGLSSQTYSVIEVEEDYSYISNDYYNWDDIDIDHISDMTITANSSVSVKFVS